MKKTINYLGWCPECGNRQFSVETENTNGDLINVGDRAECTRCGCTGEIDSDGGAAFMRPVEG